MSKKRTFYSKRSWLLGAILFVPILGLLGSTAGEGKYEMALFPLAILLLLLWLWFGTRYTLVEGKLRSWAGFIPYPSIEVSKILLIKPTKSLLAAPATSFDRLLIQYGESDYLIVSPKDKKAFLSALLEINPKIEIRNS